MRGFGAFPSAARFCTAFSEIRHYFRLQGLAQLTLSEQRQFFQRQWTALISVWSMG